MEEVTGISLNGGQDSGSLMRRRENIYLKKVGGSIELLLDGNIPQVLFWVDDDGEVTVCWLCVSRWRIISATAELNICQRALPSFCKDRLPATPHRCQSTLIKTKRMVLPASA